MSVDERRLPPLLTAGRRISPGGRRVPAPQPSLPPTPQPAPLTVSPLAAAPLTLAPDLELTDLGSGRGLTYEWEFWVAHLLGLIENLGSSGGSGLAYVHTQSAAASTWNISHHLGTKPNVLLIDNTGQQLMSELHFPDDNTVVVIHNSPYSGTAYLRA